MDARKETLEYLKYRILLLVVCFSCFFCFCFCFFKAERRKKKFKIVFGVHLQEKLKV